MDPMDPQFADGASGSIGPTSSIDGALESIVPIGAFLALIALLLLLYFIARRNGQTMRRHTSNALMVSSLGMAFGAILLTEVRNSRGILVNILGGAEILDSGLEVRWILVFAITVFCYGLVTWLNDKAD